jgi:DNA-binding Lrp family transcriptional regulator
MGIRAIARQLGVHASTVSRRLRRAQRLLQHTRLVSLQAAILEAEALAKTGLVAVVETEDGERIETCDSAARNADDETR